MITVKDELLITDEINAIIIDYAQKVVLQKLLMAFSFESKNNVEEVSDLIQNLNYYGVDIKPPEIELELSEYLWDFFTALKRKEQAALYFWVLNKRYLSYLYEFECDDDMFEDSDFDRKFGRELAYKTYLPKDSGLLQDIIHELRNLLINFATELDLSLIDEYTSEQIQEEIDNYCS
ncbi:hypothetical protein [Flagellimonas iocasae]|uniref:Uncharacterized protein n=1 Tax=Flagellimonas iocasae TaxID=2055905 RepID=A0ABW4XYP6_9FLAO